MPDHDQELTHVDALIASAIIRVRAAREGQPQWVRIADALARWAWDHTPPAPPAQDA